MDWSRSYTAKWRVYNVNPNTWADAEVAADIDRVSITRTADGMLIESGSLETTGEWADGYYRIVMLAEQDAATERVDVATMLFESNSGMRNYGRLLRVAEGRSVLFPASTKRLLRGAYAPAGCNGAEYAAGLLRDAITAPVDVIEGFTLNEHVVHELSSSVLEAVWAVLVAGRFTIQITGQGRVQILPLPEKPVLELNSQNAKLLQPGISYENNDSNIPNRFTARLNARSVTVVNDLETSPVSTVSRGYIVDLIEDAVPVNGETLEAYATRRMKELSVLSEMRTYTREYYPGVLPYSVVNASIDELDGYLRVVNQQLTCGYGISIQEQAVKGVQLWQ